jgi:hypothetical protein
MEIKEGLCIGRLVEENGNLIAEVCAEKIVSLGPIKGYPVWKQSRGIQILFVLPIRDPEIIVTRDEKHEAGAFLLEPHQNLCIKTKDHKFSYHLEVDTVLNVETTDKDYCEFCRSSLTNYRGKYCLSSALDRTEAALLLCDGCANAWGSQKAE